MTHRRSVTHRLRRGLGLIGLVGSVLLLGAVGFFYWQSFVDLPADRAALRALKEVIEHVGLPMVVLMVPVSIVGLRVIQQAFVPLEAAARRIEATRGHERGFRIDESSMPTEALPFTQAVNDLLGRLDDAALRQEAFAADVAHELRTPLALLSLELDRLDGPHAARLKGDVAAMQRLIDQLMLLAQVDAAAAAQLAPEPVPLAALATDLVAAMAPGVIGAGRTIALDLDADRAAPAVAHGRREAIAAALRNLVENAVRVTPPGGTVQVRVGPGPLLAVCDAGPGLSADRLADLVRRHRRADHASRDGAGLGLAIVDRIMAAHGGALETDPDARALLLRFPD